MTEQCLRFIVHKIKQYGLTRTRNEQLGILRRKLAEEGNAIREVEVAIAMVIQKDPYITNSLFLRVFLDDMGKRLTSEITEGLGEERVEEPSTQTDEGIGTPNDMSP